jgi:excisionase family DNA binding protein
VRRMRPPEKEPTVAKQTVISGEWCDTESVMRALNISERTVQKWAELGRLRYKTIQDGSRRFRLYDSAEVEKLRQSGPPKPSREQSSNGTDHAINRQNGEVVAIKGRSPSGGEVMLVKELSEMMRDVVAKLLDERKQERDAAKEREEKERAAQEKRWEAERAAQELTKKVWLTLREASQIYGLPQQTLRDLLEQGKISGIQAGKSWRIWRPSLEEFSRKGVA